MVRFLRAIWVRLVAYGMQFDFFLHSLKALVTLPSGFHAYRAVVKRWRCTRSHQLIGDESKAPKCNSDHVQIFRPGASRRMRMVELLPYAYYWMTLRILSALYFSFMRRQLSTSEVAENQEEVVEEVKATCFWRPLA